MLASPQIRDPCFTYGHMLYCAGHHGTGGAFSGSVGLCVKSKTTGEPVSACGGQVLYDVSADPHANLGEAIHRSMTWIVGDSICASSSPAVRTDNAVVAGQRLRD